MKTSRILWLPLIASALLLCQCGVVNAVGSIFVSEQDEMQLGAEFDKQLHDSTASFPVYAPRVGHPEDTAFQNYVVNLAQSIVASVPSDEKPSYPFKFTIIDKDVVNAFAVPGGYVYIYTGIIARMKNESELACVLGHEITHVTHHHYRDAMVKDQALGLLVQVLLGRDSSQLVQLVANGFSTLAALKISRDNETDADTYGVRKAAAIQRNPMGIATFFRRMDDQGVPAVFSTHPPSPDRVLADSLEVYGDSTLKALALDTLHSNATANFLSHTAAIPPK